MNRSAMEASIKNTKIDTETIEVDGQRFSVGQSKPHKLTGYKMTIVNFAEPKAHDSEIHDGIPAIVYQIGDDFRIVPATQF